MRRNIVVYERELFWTPELQRQFLDEPAVDVRPVMTVRDVRAVADETDLCVWVLDTANAACENLLDALAAGSVPRPLVVVSSPMWTSLEWALRDLGVTAFVEESLGGEKLAELCGRLLQGCPADTVGGL